MTTTRQKDIWCKHSFEGALSFDKHTWSNEYEVRTESIEEGIKADEVVATIISIEDN